MFIPVVLGTAREGRFSEKVAKFVLEQVKAKGIESEILDVRDYRIPASNNNGEIPEAKKLAGHINRADSLIIICPEYNHGYPGELKMMLDMLYEEYSGKKVALCGVSMSDLGGARGLEQLKLTLTAFSMNIIVQTVYFAKVRELFDEAGGIKDQSYIKKVTGIIEALQK